MAEAFDEEFSSEGEEVAEAPVAERAKPVRGLGDKAYERDSEKLVNREQKDQRQRRALAAAHGPGPPGQEAQELKAFSSLPLLFFVCFVFVTQWLFVMIVLC